MEGKDAPPPGLDEIIYTCIRHLNLLCSIKGERVGVRNEKHAAWYLKGQRNSNEIKNLLNTIESRVEMEKVLLDYLDKSN